ncbi:MAG: rhodanese-like domain-containing protein [Bacteroidetes bacterium]|nr:rhodanese-like domain-containing protein [Bacteroidota bacterium]
MINKKICYLIFIICAVFCFATTARAQVSSLKPSQADIEPWTAKQLFEPSALASQLKTGSAHGMILNIGKVEDIEGAEHIGPVSQKENLEKLTKKVSALSRDTELIIYCGCCPFAKCPNIRPAFWELKRLGFTNVRVLNLATNLQTDWTSRGYPLAGK